MSRKPWEPKQEERHRFHEVYIDETSQNGHHFLVLGGIIIPREMSAEFESDIIQARRRKDLNSKGRLREMGWSEVSNGDFEDYRRVLDAYFSFAARRMIGKPGLSKFCCSVVDTTVPGRTYSTGKRGQVGFDREIYFHCMTVARRNRGSTGPLFHIYPDYRSTNEPMKNLHDMLNNGIRKEGDKRLYPFRRVQFRLSHEVQALQISDILIGALAYRLNRGYDKPGANKDKKLLCDYALKMTGFDMVIREKGFKEKTWGQHQLWFRYHADQKK
jgi:hypothetical protein